MHVSELKNELMDNYQLRIPSFVWGMPGVGKSDIMRQVCKTLGISIKDERVTQLNPVDTRGVPSVEDGYTLFNIPNLLPRVDRDGEHGIFFLDELPAARESMQAALYQLILDR
jgi:MoxR-like ATPase